MDLLSQYYHSLFSYPDKRMIQRLLRATGGPLLDLGCATGRVLDIASEMGCPAYGIDWNSDMIREAIERTKHLKDVEFIHSDVLTPQSKLFRRMGLVTIMANTFSMILETDDQKKTLMMARDYLRPDIGRILIAVANPRFNPNSGRHQQVPTADGRTVDFKIRWTENLERQLRTYDLDLRDDATQMNYQFQLRIHTLESLQDLFSSTSLEVEEKFSGFDEADFNPDAEWWIFVLRKRAS